MQFIRTRAGRKTEDRQSREEKQDRQSRAEQGGTGRAGRKKLNNMKIRTVRKQETAFQGLAVRKQRSREDSEKQVKSIKTSIKVYHQ